MRRRQNHSKGTRISRSRNPLLKSWKSTHCREWPRTREATSDNHATAIHHRSDKSLTELAQMYNPCIRGWITHYSQFYRTQLRPTLKRIDAYVIRWARRKFKRMRHQTEGARDWFDRLTPCQPNTSPIGRHGSGRTSGAV
jgi:hypothetical protein